MTDRQRVSGADNAWRRMGNSNNLTTITGLLSFTETLEYEELCAQLESRLLRFDRFKQRLGGEKRRFRRPYWEMMADFDVETHVHNISLPEPQDREQLQEFVGTLMSRPLDERRPLWEAYHLQEYEEGSAVVFRLNHSMADGFALLYVLLGLADDPSGIEFPMGGLSTPPAPGEETDSVTETQELEDGKSKGKPKENEPRSRTAAATGSVGKVGTTARGLAKSLAMGASTVRAAGRLLLMSPEPQTSLHPEVGTRKKAGWTDEMALEPIKAVGRAHDATINDVLLATTARVFRRTLEHRGENTEGLVLRCTVPVNLTPLEQRDKALGNHFGLAFVPIPVGERDLGAQIDFVRNRTSMRQLGAEAFLMSKVLTLGGIVPEPVFNLCLRNFEDNATAVVSNVPGPLDSIEIAGKEVDKIMFWNPQAVDQGVSVSIFTYDGGVRIGISGDANAVPDPAEFTDAFEDELDALVEEYA